MNTHPELIVMLTYNDVTVPQAAEVFAKCEHTRARYWGFKEAGLPFAEMRDLFARMKACGKQTCLVLPLIRRLEAAPSPGGR